MNKCRYAILGQSLEGLIEAAAATNKNPVALVETARQALSRALVRPLLSPDGELKVVTLDASLEEECVRGANLQPGQISSGALQVSVARRVLDRPQQLWARDQQFSADTSLRLSGPLLSAAAARAFPAESHRRVTGRDPASNSDSHGRGRAMKPPRSTTIKKIQPLPMRGLGAVDASSSSGQRAGRPPRSNAHTVQLPRIWASFQ